jgi:hypothetical protein
MNEYTAVEWRDIGYTRWFDPLAALENVQGAEFRKAVAKEDAIWKKELNHHSSQLPNWKRSFEKFQTSAYPETKDYAYIRCKWISGITIFIQPGSAGYTYNVWFEKEKRVVWSVKEISNISWSSTLPYFFILRDIGKGAEHLQLNMYKWTGIATLQWKRDPVGPSVEFVGNSVYYLGVENALRYHEIWKTDIETGKQTHLLFSEPDKRIQIDIDYRDSVLYVHSANALFQRIGILEKGNTVKWVTNVTKSTLLPASSEWLASDRKLFCWSKSKHDSILLPPKEHIVDVYSAPLQSLFVVTVQDGKSTLWLVWKRSWIPLLQPNCLSDIEICHFPTEFPTFILNRPSVPKTVYEFRDGIGLIQTCQFPEPLRLYTIAEGLAGKEEVPYTVVSAVPKPNKLLVDAYGAYGISSRRSYPIRWLPFLEKGYAMAYVCPRGGREKGDPWYDGGRTAERKHHTFEDTATGIQEIQTRLAIRPSATLFFGRSAGGWLAAQIAQTYGHLVAGVYAEVPYVDVLRTTTNPSLPLTQLEYDEFGDPLHKRGDFFALKKISPVDTVPACRSVNCPLVVIRTGVNDMQVLPYESLKWGAKLREKGWRRVFVGIDHDGGHFAAAKDMITQRAEDAVLLDSALNARTRRSTRRSHAGRGTRRR